MSSTTTKTLELKVQLADQEYSIHVSMLSIPDELEFGNVDMDESREFLFSIHVRSDKEMPAEVFDKTKRYFVFFRGKDDTVLAYEENGSLIDVLESDFTQFLLARVMEVIMIEGDSGHFVG